MSAMITVVADVHPGVIVFFEGERQVATRRASELPEELLFADTPRGRVPVVKVVAHIGADRREILEFGPDDQLLRSTLQLSER